MRLAFLLWAGALIAQTPSAAIIDFTPTVKRVAIGPTNCTFCLHASVPAPYNLEVACYSSAGLQLVQAALPGVTTEESFVFPGGSIIWQFSHNAANPALIDYQISGQATADAKPVIEIGTI